MSRIRIVSNGEPHGTVVYAGDNVIDGVLEVSWVSGQPGEAPTVRVTLDAAEIDARVRPENAQIVQADGVEGDTHSDGR